MAGTPLVARMPYDNKQCKAYKGLKIKYASKIIKVDENLDNVSPLITWENDVKFDGSKHNPLIDLTNKGVGAFINPNGFDRVYQALEDHVKYGKVTLITKTGEYLTDLTSAGIKQLTYNDLLFNLSPTFANFYDTVLDDEPDARYTACASRNFIL